MERINPRTVEIIIKPITKIKTTINKRKPNMAIKN